MLGQHLDSERNDMTRQNDEGYPGFSLNTLRRAVVRGLLALSPMLVLAPAQAQQVFFEDFGSCVAPSGVAGTPVGTALGLATPIGLTVYATRTSDPLLTCSNWTFSGSAWLAIPYNGTPFPGSATHAVWLNEASPFYGAKGSMSRTLTGLTVGHTYRLSAQAWTDNRNFPTALGLTFGPNSTSMAMAAGSGVQSISSDVCATSSALTLSMYENGSGTEASPVVTNVRLEDLAIPCAIPGFYTVGGTVTGLAPGQSVGLLNNGGNALTVNANGSFTFSAAVASGGAYAATVGTQPAGQICTVTSGGSGTVTNANVTNIVVNCVAAPSPVPANAPWMLTLMGGLLGLLAWRGRVARRG